MTDWEVWGCLLCHVTAGSFCLGRVTSATFQVHCRSSIPIPYHTLCRRRLPTSLTEMNSTTAQTIRTTIDRTDATVRQAVLSGNIVAIMPTLKADMVSLSVSLTEGPKNIKITEIHIFHPEGKGGRPGRRRRVQSAPVSVGIHH